MNPFKIVCCAESVPCFVGKTQCEFHLAISSFKKVLMMRTMFETEMIVIISLKV